MVDVVGVVDASTVQVTGSVAVTSPSFVDATVGDVATLPISSDDVDVEGTAYDLTTTLTGIGSSLSSIGTDLVGQGEDIISQADRITTLEIADGVQDGRLDDLEATDATLTPLIGRAEELAQAGGLEHIATAPTFAWCSPGASLGSTDHDSFAWYVPAPADFTTGSYVRFDDLVVRSYEAPGEGGETEVTSELFSQNRDGIGVFDNWGDAILRSWDADNNAWRHWLYFEWTEEGGSSEAHQLAARNAPGYTNWEVPVGVPFTFARHLEFNVSGNWRLSWYRRVWHETPTHTFDGADWLLFARVTGTGTTTIDTGVTDDWGFGQGQGRIHCRRVQVRDVGPAGTLLADLDAQDAADAGDASFTDGAGNTVTPGADASTYSPSTGGGAVDSVNGQTGTVVLDADDIADGTTNKAYTATEKTKLAGIATGATATETWAVNIDCLATPHATAGTPHPTSTLTVDTSSLKNGYYRTGTGAGSGASWKRYVSAGTYDIKVMARALGTASGRGDLLIDGSHVGYFDTSTTTARNEVYTVATGVVLTAGAHTIGFVTYDQGSGATSYTLYVQTIDLIRTA